MIDNNKEGDFIIIIIIFISFPNKNQILSFLPVWIELILLLKTFF